MFFSNSPWSFLDLLQAFQILERAFEFTYSYNHWAADPCSRAGEEECTSKLKTGLTVEGVNVLCLYYNGFFSLNDLSICVKLAAITIHLEFSPLKDHELRRE